MPETAKPGTSEAQAIADDARAVGERLNREVLARLRRANSMEYELAVNKARVAAVEELCRIAERDREVLAIWEVREALCADLHGELPPEEDVLATIQLPPEGVKPGEVIKFQD